MHDVVTTIGSKELRPDSRSKGCISGIVVKNPFFQKPKKIAALSNDKELLFFSEPEQLVCMLDHWLLDHWLDVGMKLITTFSPEWKQ